MTATTAAENSASVRGVESLPAWADCWGDPSTTSILPMDVVQILAAPFSWTSGQFLEAENDRDTPETRMACH